jgi:hypothetical protein
LFQRQPDISREMPFRWGEAKALQAQALAKGPWIGVLCRGR